MAVSPASDRNILTVSGLTRLIKQTLSDSFPAVWVKGEISTFRRWDKGQIYFNLKDAQGAVLGCVMWRTAAARLAFAPQDGMEVEAFGAITVYEARGSYQLVVEEMRPGGLGALLVALEQLKRRLAEEGLFAPERKRKLPPYPATIGVVTSPVGAAVRDVVKVLQARWPSIRIVLAPVRVQGPGAADEIAGAIARFNRLTTVDLLIVGRGGGSLEDLWAFNEEAVVRAIAGSRIPVISAVGHEVDQTLADLAADVRAATPSNAAEIAVRDRTECRRHVQHLRSRAERSIRHAIAVRRHRLENLTGKYGFRRHRDLLGVWQQRVDGLVERLRLAVGAELRAARERLERILASYGLRQWRRIVDDRRTALNDLVERLEPAVVAMVLGKRQRLDACQDRMRALSPRLVLERGYCLARAADGTLLRTATQVALGDDVTLEFSSGEADARITAVRQGEIDGA